MQGAWVIYAPCFSMHVLRVGIKDCIMSSDDQLIHITSLLKARDYEQARAELTVFLKAHPEQPEAWYLMSFAVGERARQIAALDRALKIDPSFAKASTRLIKLQTAGVARSE